MIVLIRRKNHQDAFNHGNFQNFSNSTILRWFNWHLALRSNTVSLYKCPTNVDEIMSVYAFEMGKNIFSHTISDPRAYFLTSWYTIYTYKTWILYVCMYVCSRFPKPPKVPGSWNFGSRPNLGQLKTWRSPIFEILIFTDSMGIFRVF